MLDRRKKAVREIPTRRHAAYSIRIAHFDRLPTMENRACLHARRQNRLKKPAQSKESRRTKFVAAFRKTTLGQAEQGKGKRTPPSQPEGAFFENRCPLHTAENMLKKAHLRQNRRSCESTGQGNADEFIRKSPWPGTDSAGQDRRLRLRGKVTEKHSGVYRKQHRNFQ